MLIEKVAAIVIDVAEKAKNIGLQWQPDPLTR